MGDVRNISSITSIEIEDNNKTIVGKNTSQLYLCNEDDLLPSKIITFG